MIKLKSKPPVPETLKNPKIEKKLKKIAAKICANEKLESKDFTDYWLADDVRLTLWRYQSKKCCYCERIRDSKGEPNIEHFRPKTEIKGISNPGYWWLAYDWGNLFFCCQRCNRTKSSKFPMLRGSHVRNPNEGLEKEHPILPHPVDDCPEELIDYKWSFSKEPIAISTGRNDRGQKAIEILGLDKKDLAEERGMYLYELSGLVMLARLSRTLDPKSHKQSVSLIKHTTMSDKPFAGFKREFFRRAGLQEHVSND